MVQDEIRRLSAVAIYITAFAFVCEEGEREAATALEAADGSVRR